MPNNRHRKKNAPIAVLSLQIVDFVTMKTTSLLDIVILKRVSWLGLYRKKELGFWGETQINYK